jgi:hypothetical protein
MQAVLSEQREQMQASMEQEAWNAFRDESEVFMCIQDAHNFEASESDVLYAARDDVDEEDVSTDPQTSLCKTHL